MRPINALVCVGAPVFMLALGCSKSSGTSTGNPVVNLSFSGYVAPASTKVTTQSISTLKMCFKRLRFKMAGETTNPDPSVDSDNVDFNIGEINITPTGSNLGVVSIPAGTYTRIEFDLEDSCASSQSIQVSNSNGSFTTASRITIKFDGTFEATQGAQSLALGLQQIIDALNTVGSNSDIKTKAEGASGTF